MGVAGTYEVTVKTPMGDQKGQLTVVPEGDGWSGKLSGALGEVPISGGRVNGDTIAWQMGISVPMPLSLDCEATISGDSLSGTVKAGAFGSMAIAGVRV
ncbi:MAG TPA: hypothetical protein VFP14_03985 [Novosphingobium sp.]|nr:hypothetical protein [Novosphingobium sp.]